MRCVALLLALMLAPAVATAEDDGDGRAASDAERARALFERGRAAVDAQRYDDAVEMFRASREIEANVATIYNLALASELSGRAAEATRLFEQLLQDEYGSLTETQRLDVRQRLEAVRERVATLRIAASGASRMRVSVDGERLPEVLEDGGMAELTVNPGTHTVEVQPESGGGSTRDRVDLEAGETARVRLVLAAPSALQPAPPGEPADREPSTGGIAPWVWVTLGALAAGGAAVGIWAWTSDGGNGAAPAARVETLSW